MAQQASIPKGTRDFTPQEMSGRNFIFDNIRSVFQNFGYKPIETPAMENLSTLMGKYGEEGDRLLFKILNSGDFLSDANANFLAEKNSNKILNSISEKGLRYDLTVPFARFVVQHRNEITFPFKRYQIQPVWRADRPQKGRYREFYQCDVDVIGSNSLLNEVELIRMIDYIFQKLNINIIIKLNNRKVLSGIAEMLDSAGLLTDITTAMDKLDKIGEDKVFEELLQRGLNLETIDKLKPILGLKGDNSQKLDSLRNILGKTEDGKKGIEELQTVLNLLSVLNLKAKVELDQSLARGLNYYTGAIIEVKATDVNIGSVCGGGRYDNLTGVFGLADVSGVGVSFGADRIYDVMKELQLFPRQVQQSVQVMLVNFGEKEATYSLKIIERMQQVGISSELYPDADKMKKQLKYADQKGVKYVMLIGEHEMESGQFTLKNMKSGEQINGDLEELIFVLKKPEA
jgi:histidyl-tRNA synthetase